MTMKRVQGVYRAPRGHWVGDGFPVRSLFDYQRHAKLDPFLLLDYAGPAVFSPTEARRGVGRHPHRGFETVTIVYAGEVAHRDSTGRGGVIGPGDVQWMTAGAGILHEELHSERFGRAGGEFEMIQLWVNLPARHKLTPPAYQGISAAQIPEVSLPEGGGTARIIAGELLGESHAYLLPGEEALRALRGAEGRSPAERIRAARDRGVYGAYGVVRRLRRFEPPPDPEALARRRLEPLLSLAEEDP